MRCFLFFLSFLVAVTVGHGQEIARTQKAPRFYKNAFELRHDNDFLLFTDRYYTTGTFLGITSLGERKNETQDKRQYRFYLQQEIFTPTDLLGKDSKDFDRPYAGFIGLSNGLTFSNEYRLWDFEFVFGFTGPFSGAEWLQSYFHETAAEDSRIATWQDQIKTSLLANIYTSYIREWQLESNPFDVYIALHPKVAIGTRDIYLQNDVVCYLGKRNALAHTAAYQQLGATEKELFFAVRVGYRYVFHNTLLEGVIIWENSSLFVKDPYPQVFLYNFEMFHRSKRNSYKLSYNFETPQTRGTKPHLYMVLSFIRSF